MSLSAIRAVALLRACLRTQVVAGWAAVRWRARRRGHDDDHGPVDVGLVTVGQPFVVPDGPAMASDPRQRAFYYPAAGQDLESMQVIGSFHDLEGELERCLGRGDQLAGVAAVGPGEPDRGECLLQVP